MAINHGVSVTERSTSVSAPVVAATGIPFVVGVAPVHTADNPATAGVPVLCTSWDEAVSKLGYSEEWDKFTLCEFMYSHFVLYGMQPVIFLNLLDLTTMKAPVAAKDYDVVDHKVNLGALAMNNDALVVKANDAALTIDTDYKAYYSNGELIVELLSSGTSYAAAKLNIAHEAVAPANVTTSAVAVAMEKVELCMTLLGETPDMICAPGFSHDAAVAAVMASKAAAINGMFKAKALIDIPTGEGGATVYSDVLSVKNARAMTDKDQLPCWPMVGFSGKKYHMSTHLAGVMASVDTENGDPRESPSNKAMKIDSLITEDDSEVLLTLAQANILNGNGIITALNFMGGFKAWGNYTACYPTNTDVKDYFISVSRVFDWVGNTLIRTFWSYLDKPMTRRLIDSILDTANIWMNGLAGSGCILGGRVEMIESENTQADLMAGIIKLHVYITPPSPLQELDFTLEYDVSYVQEALAAQ